MSEGIPLEQGLRHDSDNHHIKSCLSEGIPLEQGLRQNNCYNMKQLVLVRGHSIRTRIKTKRFTPSHWYLNPSEGIPLEQGLRHCCECAHRSRVCVRGHSIRTRIKTYCPTRRHSRQSVRGHSIRTRIKTNIALLVRIITAGQRAFH